MLWEFIYHNNRYDWWTAHWIIELIYGFSFSGIYLIGYLIVLKYKKDQRKNQEKNEKKDNDINHSQPS
jgi:hypothetical protein